VLLRLHLFLIKIKYGLVALDLSKVLTLSLLLGSHTLILILSSLVVQINGCVSLAFHGSFGSLKFLPTFSKE